MDAPIDINESIHILKM